MSAAKPEDLSLPNTAQQATDSVEGEMQLTAVGEALTLTNTILLVIIGYLIYHLFGPRLRKRKYLCCNKQWLNNFVLKIGKDDDEELKLPEPLPKHDMTLDELRNYDGTGSDKRICIAILGRVYDVTKSECCENCMNFSYFQFSS